MKEIIVIRTSDPDGSVFRSILGALQGKDVQILHAADLELSSLTLGDIEIFPEQRRVTKAGVEICLREGEKHGLLFLVNNTTDLRTVAIPSGWEALAGEAPENGVLILSGKGSAVLLRK